MVKQEYFSIIFAVPSGKVSSIQSSYVFATSVVCDAGGPVMTTYDTRPICQRLRFFVFSQCVDEVFSTKHHLHLHSNTFCGLHHAHVSEL